jgi:hypothetical protein
MHTAQRFAEPDIDSDIPTISDMVSDMVEGTRERDILDSSIQLSPVKIFGEVPIAQTQAVPRISQCWLSSIPGQKRSRNRTREP